MRDDFPVWGIPAQQQHGLLVVATVLAGISLLYALALAKRARDFYPLFVWIGSGLAVCLEPIGDIFTQVVYPHSGQVSAFTAWGRHIPLWMVPNYLFFFSLPILLMVRYLVRPDVSAHTWWTTYLLLALFVGTMELPGLHSASWKYYADPGLLNVQTYPVWVAFNNAECLLSSAVGICLLHNTVIRKSRSFLFIVLTPLIICGSHIAPSIPIATAAHSGAGPALLNATATVTVAFDLLLVWLGLALVRLPSLTQPGRR